MAFAVLKCTSMSKSMAGNLYKSRAFASVAVGTDLVSAVPDVSLQKARSWDKGVSSKLSTTALKDIFKDKKVVIFSLPQKSSDHFAQNTEILSKSLGVRRLEILLKLLKESQVRHKLKEFDNLCKDKKLKEALGILHVLYSQGFQIDTFRLFTFMSLCGEAKALEEAKDLHNCVTKSRQIPEINVHNKILEMFTLCDSVPDAYAVFNSMPQRNHTSCCTMITCLAKNNLGGEAIDLFTQFKQSGLKPDDQMFFGVFLVCGDVGDV